MLLLGLVRLGDGPWWEGDQPRVGVRVRVSVRVRVRVRDRVRGRDRKDKKR